MASRRKKRGKNRSVWLEFAMVATAFTGILVLVAETVLPNIPGKDAVEQLDLVAVAILAVLLFLEFSRAESKRLFLKRYWLDVVVIIPFMAALRLLRGLRAEVLLGRGLARVLIGFVEPGVLVLERARKAVGSAMSLKTVVDIAKRMLGL
ncbi:MAG: ion transporter [Candidatus Micrarchaeia archaeon]